MHTIIFRNACVRTNPVHVLVRMPVGGTVTLPQNYPMRTKLIWGKQRHKAQTRECESNKNEIVWTNKQTLHIQTASAAPTRWDAIVVVCRLYNCTRNSVVRFIHSEVQFKKTSVPCGLLWIYLKSSPDRHGLKLLKAAKTRSAKST